MIRQGESVFFPEYMLSYAQGTTFHNLHQPFCEFKVFDLQHFVYTSGVQLLLSTRISLSNNDFN